MAYIGFDRLKNQLSHEAGVDNPGAVAAAIGRKKYGAKKMAKAAASGKSLRRAATLSQMKGGGGGGSY